MVLPKHTRKRMIRYWPYHDGDTTSFQCLKWQRTLPKFDVQLSFEKGCRNKLSMGRELLHVWILKQIWKHGKHHFLGPGQTINVWRPNTIKHSLVIKHFTVWTSCLVMFDRVWSCLIGFDSRCFVRLDSRVSNMFDACMRTTIAQRLVSIVSSVFDQTCFNRLATHFNISMFGHQTMLFWCLVATHLSFV